MTVEYRLSNIHGSVIDIATIDIIETDIKRIIESTRNDFPDKEVLHSVVNMYLYRMIMDRIKDNVNVEIFDTEDIYSRAGTIIQEEYSE